MLEGSAGRRVGVHPPADELGSESPYVCGRVTGEHRDRGRQHGCSSRAAGVRLAPVAGQRVRCSDPHLLGRVAQRPDQRRNAGGIHHVVEDLAAVLAHPRIGVAQSLANCGGTRRAKPDQPLIRAD